MTWTLILITWLGLCPIMTQDFLVEDEAACREMESNFRETWKDAPREFVFVIDCREKPLKEG